MAQPPYLPIAHIIEHAICFDDAPNHYEVEYRVWEQLVDAGVNDVVADQYLIDADLDFDYDYDWWTAIPSPYRSE